MYGEKSLIIEVHIVGKRIMGKISTFSNSNRLIIVRRDRIWYEK